MPALLLVGGLLLLATSAPQILRAAEMRVEVDYAAVLFEAEDHDAREDRWVLTGPATPAQSPDPDGNHSDSASGNLYLELLPDTRVTHEDELIQGENYWSLPGSGPILSWSVEFPEPGRYFVHVRALSTGGEDNGWHVGLNDTWPDSAREMQMCARNLGWTWTSRQRGKVEGEHCGVEKTLWLDVPSAGTHDFRISAREDGVELDRMILIKDRSGNRRICSPGDNSEIECRNGSLQLADELVDLQVELDAGSDEATLGEPVSFTLNYANRDRPDDAVAVVIDVDVDGWVVVSADEPCMAEGDGLRCDVGNVRASGGDEQTQLSFELRPLDEGLGEIVATISSESEDDVPENDTARVRVDVLPPMPFGAPTVAIDAPDTLVENRDGIITIRVGNTGEGPIGQAQLDLNSSGPIDITTLAANCGRSGANVRCVLGDLEPDDARSLSFALNATGAGSVSFSTVLTGENIETDAAAAATIDVQAVEPPGQESTGGTTGGTTTVSTSGGDSGTGQAMRDGGSGTSSALLLAVLLSVAGWRRRSPRVDATS